MMKQLLVLFLLTIGISSIAFAETINSNIKSVTAITEVFGEGQKVTAAAVEYEGIVKNTTLEKDSFSVEGRTVTKIYSNSTADKTAVPVNGKYVIIELSAEDSNAMTFLQQGRTSTLVKAEVEVKQNKAIETTLGETYKAFSTALKNSEVKNLIADDFLNLEFYDVKYEKSLAYNLYVPENYDPSKSYPLVFFGHDAGVTSDNTIMTLSQGIGADIWASPSEQAKRECFVLAPQYSEQFISDEETTDYLEMTVDLINSIANQYSIDENRIYATGQSGGCMLSIVMTVEYPDMFAAMFLVAGQWDAEKMAETMSDKNLWIVVSQGDMKAYPGMNASTEAMEENGAKVSRAVWSGLATSEEIAENAKNMLEEDTNIKYVVLQKGTVVPQGQVDDPGSNHINTWRIAYTFEPIRDWLFTQVK